MKSLWVFALCLPALVLVSCQEHGAPVSAVPFPRLAGPGEAMGKCLGCGIASAEGSLCPHCLAVAVTKDETVHCDKCDKDFKAGMYCAKCNAFLFKEMADCAGRQVRKGVWCPETNTYAGLPNTTWCAKCKKPYDKVSEPDHEGRGCARKGVY